MSPDSVAASSRRTTHGHLRGVAALLLTLGVGGLGCFRATGVARGDVAVEEIPVAGGDRIAGLKATAGPGDFFLGNDSVQLAVDGAAFGDREGQFGAPSGGAILDVGSISLDQSFHRVSMPTDMLERLGPVANQDPDLPLVFDRYLPGTGVNSVFLDMQGYLLDPKGKLGVTTDTQGRIPGVTVSHRITLNKAEAFFTLETTLTNVSGPLVAVQSLGDFLSQHGGGFRFVVPAMSAFDGSALPTAWGVEIPGTDFTGTNALKASVQARMVALMGSESAGNTLDSHASLGIMPLDVDSVLVASDPQHALTENRPLVPGRLVVGSPVPPGTTPGTANLGPGQSISYRRRLYAVGGPSYSVGLPAQATVVFNLMAQARAGLRGIPGEGVGFLAYSSFGTALPGGPLQTEFRFERYTYSGSSPNDDSNLKNPANWLLERAEWREPVDINPTNSAIGMLLPVVPDPNFRYRVTARNRNQVGAPLYLGTNVYVDPIDPNKNSQTPYLPLPITPSVSQNWQISESLSPERADVIDTAGNVVRTKLTAHGFSARQAGTLEFAGLNPLRITLQGVGVPDPSVQRTRRLSSIFYQITKAKFGVGSNYGAYQYTAGNQIFGTAFGPTFSTSSMYLAPGDYLAYATRGPMSYLDSLPVKAFDGQLDNIHGFVVFPPSLPSGWTSFDIPAPTQATSGGFNPGEMLSSAVAEGVQVVARTEQDLLTDPSALYTEFRAEIDIPAVSDAQRAPLGNDPFVVGARSATLGDGFTTALFTPAPTTDRSGGARPSKGWNLAEFITQAEGAYTVVHQPRSAAGLFTVRGFDRTVPLGTGVNAWWNQTGPASLGRKIGEFDALELIHAEGCDPADPTAWYAEFTNVRNDWYAILSQQTPATFIKGLGLSAAKFSLDTPVGLARTYLNLGSAQATLVQADLSSVLIALQRGAAVASTGPMLDVLAGPVVVPSVDPNVGPGGLLTLVNPSNTSINLRINLYAPDWVPVDEVRVVVNGAAPIQVPLASFAASSTDFRLRTATVTVPMPAGKDAWLVVEAGVSRAQVGPYQVGTPWNKIMKGIYPIAITNPIFVDVNGGGYTPPGF